MIKIQLLAICMLTLTAVQSSAIEISEEQEFLKEISLLKDGLNDSATLDKIYEISLASWPTTRPFGTAKTITVSRFRESFDLYMWWEQGYLFAEAVPLGGTDAFICGPGWGFVQNLGNSITFFDTARFEDETESSVCGDFSSPKVFVIIQYEFLNDRVADFRQPFNFVSTRNAEHIVRVNGGVSLNSNSAESTEKGVVRTDLSISIPAIDLESISGTAEIYLDLKYNGSTSDGTPTWVLDKAGYNQ